MSSTPAVVTSEQVAAFFPSAAEALRPFLGGENLLMSCTFVLFASASVKAPPLFAVQVGGGGVITNPDFNVALRLALADIDPDKLRAEASKLRAQAAALDAHVDTVATADENQTSPVTP